MTMTPLIRFGIGWGLGIVLARQWDLSWVLITLLLLPIGGALLLYRSPRPLKNGLVIALGLTSGAIYFSWSQPTIDAHHIAYYNHTDTPLTLVGTVSDEPDIRDSFQNLKVDTETIQKEGLISPITGSVLIRASRYPEYQYGDRLAVTGSLETPPIFEDFSYKDYLARQGIHTLLRHPHIKRLETDQDHSFWRAVFHFKKQASQTINRILPEPHASLLNGILLGLESNIPSDLYEDFNLTGTSHIIVISGSNISVIAGILLLLGQHLIGKRWASPLAILGIIGYTLLIGADAPVSRAAVMGIIWVLSIWVGRPGLALNTLVAAGIVLTAFNPLILWDVGFQLSFAAVLGLILLVPPLEYITFRLLRHQQKQLGILIALLNELIVITLAAQIITAPLILYHFGRLSLISLLTNLLILPVQPPIMLVGGVTTVIGLIWLPLGQLLGWVVHLPLAWTVWVVTHTAPWPYASLVVNDFPFWLLILSYSLIAAATWWANQTKMEQPFFHLPSLGTLTTRWWVGGIGTVFLITWLAILNLPDGRLHVTFLDVGQGDAIFITLPDGRQMLIDGGPSSSVLNWRLGQMMPFWDRSLDIVINTHPDADHLAGLVPLIDRYHIAQIIIPDVEPPTQLYQAWTSQMIKVESEPLRGQAGLKLTLDKDITVTLLNPGPASQNESEVNNHSIVIHLQYKQTSFLLPGDIEAPVERKLATTYPHLSATVLKSPHHGSKSSSSEQFLATIDPQLIVISVEENNRFGHPAPEIVNRYTQRGATILRTDEMGTIDLSTDGQNLWVTSWP